MSANQPLIKANQPLIKQLWMCTRWTPIKMCSRWSPDKMIHSLSGVTLGNDSCYHSNRPRLDHVHSSKCLHTCADRQGQCTSGAVPRTHFKCPTLSETTRLCRTNTHTSYSCLNLQPYSGKRHASTMTLCLGRRPCSVVLDKHASFHSATSGTMSVDRSSASFHSDTSSGMSVDRSSALFISNSAAQHTGSIPVPLELEDILVNRFSDLEASVKSRRWTAKLDMPLQDLVDDYKKMTALHAERALVKRKRKEVVEEIHAIDEQNYDDRVATAMKEKLKVEGRSLKEQNKRVTYDLWPIERRVMLSSLSLPNLLLPNTPEHFPVVIKERPASNEHDDVQYSHTDSVYNDIIHFSPVGMRSYYLCGEAAILEQELTAYVCDSLQNSGLIQISGSDYFRSVITEGCGNDFADTQQVLTLELTEPKTHDQIENAYHLSGAGLESFAAYLAWSKIKTDSLPLKLYTTGRCYSGAQLPVEDGLFSATQTSNVEVFGAASSLEDCLSLAQDIENLVWEIHSSLDLPIRLVDIPSDVLHRREMRRVEVLHRREMRRVEVQARASTADQFVTVGSVSIIGDYVSQRLAMKHSHYVNQSPDLTNLYIVHGCAANITRLVACCVENGLYNQETGRFVLPDCVPRYLSNIESTS